MSTAPTPLNPTPPPTKAEPILRSITIVSHSQLVYWWPVWVFGFLFGLLTYFGGGLMVVVPDKSKVVREVVGVGEPGSKRTIILVPDDPKALPADEFAQIKDKDGKLISEEPRLHVSRSRGMGVLFCIILLLVIVITNVPLRGLWSVIVIVGIILMALIFQLAGIWDSILTSFALLDIRINAGGYFFIATVLLIIWLFTVMIFDRQMYIVFTPGQLKICTEIGGGEKVYDAFGLHIEKQRSDLFRHWILGLGSGDLIVKTSGAQSHQFDLPNVLFIGRKVAQIEELMKMRNVDVNG